ncbi:hypothetical protein ACQ4PT_065083 [Festuca glaucescens]
MEATALSIGKSVLNGALNYAKSALAEEVALQLGVRRDQFFITNELEMMQAFLMAAHDEGHDNKVVKVWVKQVRDVAYAVEDTLQEFSVRLHKQCWWRIRRTLLDRRHVAKQMKELRANVEDVSQRNIRYHHIKGSSSKPATTGEQPAIASTTMSGAASGAPEHKQLVADQTLNVFYKKGSQDGMNSAEAGSSSNVVSTGVNNPVQKNILTRVETQMVATLEESRLIGRGSEKSEIIKLVSDKEVQHFNVISLWGMGGIGKTTLVKDIYQSEEISGMFEKRACVTVMRPFNCEEHLKSLSVQFGGKEATTDLARNLEGKRYLLVLDDVSSTSEWDSIVQHLPKAAASCIIVTTRENNVAKHCSKDERNIHKLNNLSHDDASMLFTKKVFKETIDLDGQYPALAEQAELILRKFIGKLERTRDARCPRYKNNQAPKEYRQSPEAKLSSFWSRAVEILYNDIDLNCHDACTAICCHWLPFIAMRLDLHGVLVQSGMRKLKALHTLGVVNIAMRGNDVLKDIEGLIQLRKLGVTGVNKENGQELCLAIVGLSRLESLSIWSEGEPGLSGCLDGEFSFPENLQSHKLYGNLVKLPEWIQGLTNLVKLKLRSSRIPEHDEAIQVLGDLPNLASLHLLTKSFEQSNACLTFCPHMFPNLVVLELYSLLIDYEDENKLLFLKFERGAAPKLELLNFRWADINSRTLSGLPSLASLKEVLLEGPYTNNELAYLRAELAENQSRPVIKMV